MPFVRAAALLAALSACAQADAAPRRKPHLACRVGTLTTVEGIPTCLSAPVWVR